MKVKINELIIDAEPGTTAQRLVEDRKPDADIVILNGFPLSDLGQELIESDELVLIRRGEQVTAEEMETLLVSRHTPGVHEKIRCATVGIAGLGGLGSQIAISLARIGVGKLVLADFDVVEPSNLNRQQYFIDQLGMFKTEALCATLGRVNPFVELKSYQLRLTQENIPEIYSDCSILIEAFDRPDQKAMLIETALTRMDEVKVIGASGLAGYEPADTVLTHRLGENLYVVGDLETAARQGQGLMAPRVGVAANAQANLALRLLMDEDI